MHKWAQGSPVPSYLTNSSDLNLGGMITWGKFVKLSRSTLPREHELSIMCIFSVNFSTWIHFLFTSLWANVRWGPIIVRIQRRCLIFKLGPKSCCSGVGPYELCPPPITYHCIICIISTSCSFRRLMSLALSSTG